MATAAVGLPLQRRAVADWACNGRIPGHAARACRWGEALPHRSGRCSCMRGSFPLARRPQVLRSLRRSGARDASGAQPSEGVEAGRVGHRQASAAGPAERGAAPCVSLSDLSNGSIAFLASQADHGEGEEGGQEQKVRAHLQGHASQRQLQPVRGSVGNQSSWAGVRGLGRSTGHVPSSHPRPRIPSPGASTWCRCCSRSSTRCRWTTP